MKNDISTEERIDQYLLGRMTEAERTAFEKEMDEDSDLREEYESQREVANAVRRAAMKDFLIRHSKKRRTRFSGMMILWTVASVAAILIAVVGVNNYSSTVHALQQNGLSAFSQLEQPVTRGGDQLDAWIAEAYMLLEGEEYEAASAIIEKAKESISQSLAIEVTSEESAYEHGILQMKYYDLPFAIGVYDVGNAKTLASKQFDKPLGKGYNWYKLPGLTRIPKWGYIYLTRAWTTQLDVSNPLLADKEFEIWASVKFTGPKFFADSTNKNYIYIDRVVLVEPQK